MLPTRRWSSQPTSLEGETATRELIVQPGVYAYYAWKNVSVGVWVGQAVKSAVSALIEVSRAHAKVHPTGRSSVVFVLDQVAAPKPDAQEEMKILYEVDGLKCTAVVVEGAGFWASGIRSMANNVRREAGSSMSLSVGSSIDDVVRWLPPVHFELTGITLPVADLHRALSAIRAMGAERARAAPTSPL